LLLVIAKLHVPVPLHAPPQAENVNPAPGTSDNVTVDPDAKEALQTPGHEMPAGFD
jgi:hypothetical protein